MKKLFALTAAAGLLASISVAAAQDREGMWMGQSDSGDWMVYGPDNTDGSMVMMDTGGAKPADCPAGTYYESANDQIMACDDDAMFNMVTPESGSMMPSGEAWAEGAMMLEYREN